ncbi:MAG TPA: transglutaminase N-terminal domain-containing protein, partial [Povalibacter sp.]
MSDTVAYQVRHQTVYRYSGDVVHSHQLLHLTPRESARQTCSAHDIAVQPAPTHSAADIDGFGNPVLRLEFDRPHQCLSVTADVSVEVHSVAGRPSKSESWERVRTQL